MPAKHDFSYLSCHLSEWNESKLSMITKINTIELSIKSIKTEVFDQSFAKLMVAKQLLLFSYNSNFRNT